MNPSDKRRRVTLQTVYQYFVNEYIIQLFLNVTYDDQIILDTVAYLCNIHIRIISSLGLQIVVDIAHIH